MTSEAIIVGVRDPHLEQLLGAARLRTSVLAPSELSTLAHAAARQPDLVVVDIRGGSLPPAVAALTRQHPTTPVLVVVSSLEPTVVLEAMRAGANECVAEPLQASEIDAAITRLLAHKRPGVGGRVFAFIGAKGGVGTTTTAVNVAATLANGHEGRTLLIDLHLAHGDAAVFLGVEPRYSVVDALDNIHRFDEAFFKGLAIQTAAGPHLLASSDRALAQTSSVQRVRSLVEFVTSLYEFVVLDVPRSDAAALDSLDHAARIVVVANQELATVRNASRIASGFRQRYGQDRVSVIVNRLDNHAEIGPADIEKVIGSRILRTMPSDYRMALRALNRGRPLVLDHQNKLASGFRELADDLTGVAARSPRTEPGGLFGLLRGRK